MLRPSRLPPVAGVVAIVVVLLTVSALVWAGELAHLGTLSTPEVPWWVLAPFFALVEGTVLHVQVRREAQAVSLNEMSIMVALFLARPVDMLIATILGSVVVYVGFRRQSALKATFNIAVRIFGVTVALVVFRALSGPALDIAPRAWLAGLLAVAATGACDALLVLAVVALYERVFDLREVRHDLLTSLPISAIVGALGLIAVIVLHTDPRNAVLLVVVGTALLAGYRAHASLYDRHVSLARLYEFGRSVNEAHQVDEVLTTVLTGARDLLRAEAAELVLLAPGDDTAEYHRWVLEEGSATVTEQPHDVQPLPDGTIPGVWASVLAGQGPLLLARQRRARSVNPQLADSGYREAVIVPLLDESGILGHLMVAERMGQVRTFHPADVPLLDTVANQAGLALRNSRLMQRLRREALHDVLTGLANRAKFGSALDEAITEVNDGDSSGLTVMLVDLDGFKEVNDSLGHHNGDVLLVHVSAQLAAAGAEADGPAATVARLGGDEFAVLLPGSASTENATALAERIHAAIGTPILIENVEISVRASVGIALAPADGREAALLLRHADEAMYAAKTNGGGTQLHHAVARPDQNGQTPLALLAELRKAIERREITMYVQPQAYAATGQVYGAEALVRWIHPTLGLLPPAEFLALADRHALMYDLTYTVLDQSVEAAASWLAAGLDLTISVNLSARSLTDVRLLPDVQQILARHGLPPSLLILEITEDCVIDDPDRAISLLNALRSTGVRLSVDDFGTGYSSLSYLRRLPVDEVKIDRSFITTLAEDPDSQVIVRAITDLGTNLGLHVIAEGVEDQENWDHLTALGCHGIQGFYLARPMPASHLPPWLHGHQLRLAEATGAVPDTAAPVASRATLPISPRLPTG